MANQNDILKTVRELSFDRFPIPAFVLKLKDADHKITSNSNSFKINDGTTDVATIDYNTKPTLQELTEALIGQQFHLAYSGYYRGDEPNTNLIPMTAVGMGNNVTALLRNFFSDDSINNFLQKYFNIVLCAEVELSDIDAAIQELDPYSLRHLSLFTAIMLVDYRRLFEYSTSKLGNYFTDGSGDVMDGTLGMDGDNISVNIGSVFSLTDDLTTENEQMNQNYTLTGSEDFFGDKNSFWYRLFLWLRDKLEQEYQDYYFRKDNGIWGGITLIKPLNFRAYFDSYPFTYSPYGREIR